MKNTYTHTINRCLFRAHSEHTSEFLRKTAMICDDLRKIRSAVTSPVRAIKHEMKHNFRTAVAAAAAARAGRGAGHTREHSRRRGRAPRSVAHGNASLGYLPRVAGFPSAFCLCAFFCCNLANFGLTLLLLYRRFRKRRGSSKTQQLHEQRRTARGTARGDR